MAFMHADFACYTLEDVQRSILNDSDAIPDGCDVVRDKPTPFIFQNRTDGPHDLILLAEFSEIEGPMVVHTVPADAQRRTDVELSEFVIQLMSTDYQVNNIGEFRVCSDASLVRTNISRGAAAYLHYFTLFDLRARGFVRPFCIAYVSKDANKLAGVMPAMLAEFSAVSEDMKKANRDKFTSAVTQSLEIIRRYEMHSEDDDTTTKFINAEVASKRINVRLISAQYSEMEAVLNKVLPVKSDIPHIEDTLSLPLLPRSLLVGQDVRLGPFSSLIGDTCHDLMLSKFSSILRKFGCDLCLINSKTPPCPMDCTPDDITVNYMTPTDILCNLAPGQPGYGLLHLFSQFPRAVPHLIFSLLVGRTVVLTGAAESCTKVKNMAVALIPVIPIPKHKTARVLKWHSGIIVPAHLSTYKIIGLCIPERLTIHEMVHYRDQSRATMLDVETGQVSGPAYSGHLLASLTKSNTICAHRDDLSILTLLYSVLTDIEAEVFMHCETQSDGRLKGGDLEIVKYLSLLS